MEEPDQSSVSDRIASEAPGASAEPSPRHVLPPDLTPSRPPPVEPSPEAEANPTPPRPVILRVAPVEARLSQAARALAEAAPSPRSSPPPASEPTRPEADPQQIPARMLNEFVYCQRLFYYEFVESVFVENADTLRGEAIHQRVDSGNGALPRAKA